MQRLQDAMPRLTADQAETVLARAREAGLDGDNDLVRAALDRLEATGGKRRANAARRWFGEAGARDERRAAREARGTRSEQQQAYAEYLQDIAAQLEAANRGGSMVRRAPGDREVPDVMTVLASNPATMRARLSPESLEALARIGTPLSFDAWRHEYLGDRDRRAVESHQRRTAGYFSEYG